jgi:hypothetical protein
MTIKDQAIVEATRKGYTAQNGKIYNKDGKEVKLGLKNGAYLFFSVRDARNRTVAIMVHRFVAYQKFGDKIFDKKIHVRHMDSNSQNNNESNLELGTVQENMLDKSKEVRVQAALKATAHVKKHDHSKIIDLKNQGLSYKQIMKELGITSKGTIHFALKLSHQAVA